mgnify:CR=1 FL=1
MFRIMVTDLLRHGQIKTTDAKAKELLTEAGYGPGLEEIFRHDGVKQLDSVFV